MAEPGTVQPGATPVPGAVRGLARSGAVLAGATLAANVLGYVLVLALSRLLPPADYGAVGALLNLAVIGLVPALAVQLVAARRTAARAARGPTPASARSASAQGAPSGWSSCWRRRCSTATCTSEAPGPL